MLFPFSSSVRRLTRKVRSWIAGDRSVPAFDDSLRGPAADLGRFLEIWRQQVLAETEALRGESQAKSEIFETIGEGLIGVNSAKRVVLANARIGDLFDLTDDPFGRPLVQVLRHSSILAAFDRALAGHEVVDAITLELPSGTRHMEMRVIPFATGSDIAVMALFVDVTRLTGLERIRRDFIADFSHEVRNPLAALRTAIETLENTSLTPEQEEKLRKVIARQLRRLERLMEDLSELDQIESGVMVLQREPTELLRLLRDLRDDFVDQTHQRRISVAVEGDETTAHVDPSKVQQIFANLIENAIKFSKSSTTVRVVVVDTPGESIVRIIDQGEGIPPEEHERIFNRFYRVDKSRSQEVVGIGLGLAITKHLVLRHGGTIRVSSDPGRGSTFEVRLPKGVRPTPVVMGSR